MLARDSLSDLLAVRPGRPATLDVPESCVVTGDEGALRQVLANLLANVRVHTAPDSPVHVRPAASGGLASIEVTDDGPGMTAELAARARDRFARGDAGHGPSCRWWLGDYRVRVAVSYAPTDQLFPD